MKRLSKAKSTATYILIVALILLTYTDAFVTPSVKALPRKKGVGAASQPFRPSGIITTKREALQISGGAQQTVAGRIVSFTKKIRLTPKKVGAIEEALHKSPANVAEFLVVIAIGWGAVPVMKFIMTRVMNKEEGESLFGLRDYPLAKLVGQFFKIYTLVYLADCLAIVSSAMGIKTLQKINFASLVYKISFSIWVTTIIRNLKRSYLKSKLKRAPQRAGKYSIYDRLTNGLLYFATGMTILDILNLNMGMAMSSLLSIGGVGTLVFSLASKDLAEQLVSGLSISTMDRFYEGEEIQLGDGTAGIVHKLGWAHTEIRQYNEVIVSIPNGQLFNQRVMNLSRVQRSQVKQTIWFSYDDIDKMSLVTEEIKKEIEASCLELIRAGRPFRAHWREMEGDHLEVVVDCHFDLPPVGDAYWDNRQKVLEAISRATKRCGVDFALPSYAVVTPAGAAIQGQGQGALAFVPPENHE